MGERETSAQVAIEENIGQVDTQTREIISGNAIEDKDDKELADNLNGEQLIEGRMKEIDAGNSKNDVEGNCNLALGKDIDEARCPIDNENDQGRGMVTDSNGQEVEVKTGEVEQQKFEGKGLHDEEFDEVGEKVEENDIDLREGESVAWIERDEGKEESEEKSRDGGVKGESKDKGDIEAMSIKEDNEVPPLQDKNKEDAIAIQGEDEKEKWISGNDKKYEKEEDSKENENEEKDDEVAVDSKKDENDLGNSMEGETDYELEIKANESATEAKIPGNVNEDEAEVSVDTTRLQNEKDNDEEINVDAEFIKVDKMEVEGKDIEGKNEEMDIDQEKIDEDESKEENDEECINEVKEDKNENMKPEGEVKNTVELEKVEEKESEDEEKETEGEMLEKKFKKPEKISKRKGKRSRSGKLEKRKVQKHGISVDKDAGTETYEEDDGMKEKSDDEKRSPKLSKKLRLSARKSAEKKHEVKKTVKKNNSALESAEETMTPYIDRPQRERKTVERLVSLIEKDASRDLKIGKGRGTPLKDIPNVLHKVSRRKTDDTLKLLHTILFGRRGKAIQVKNNVLRFSGFVWADDEDKHRSKAKLKFEKCNKEKLLEFCDLFDISVTKGSSKKEDIISKLVEFLLNPHALATPVKDKDNQNNKRKRTEKDSSSKIASSKSSSKRKKTSGSKRSKKRVESDYDDSDNAEEEANEEDENDDDIEEKHYEEKKEERCNSSEEKSDENDESEEEYKGNRSLSKKKRSTSKTKKFHLSAKKKPTKSSRKKPSKSTAKGHSDSKEKVVNSKDKNTLSDDELRDATCEILNQVDFNTATFTDILKLLGKQFNTDLTSRKASIKMMIQEELTKFAEEEAHKD